MDINEIINYVKKLNDSIITDYVIRIYNTLIRYNLDEDFLDKLNNLIFSDTAIPDNNIIDKIRIIISDTLDTIFSLLEVTINDEALLSFKLDIADAILDIESYEDKTTLIRLLESDYSDVELFGEIMVLFTSYGVEETMSHVEEIGNVFKLALKRLIVENEQNLDLEDVLTKQKTKIDKYNIFKGTTDAISYFSDQFLDNVLTIGLPFKDYLNIYLNKDHGSLQQIAIDLTGMAILSKDSETEPYVSIIRKNISLIKTDVKDTSAIDVVVGKILSRLINNG